MSEIKKFSRLINLYKNVKKIVIFSGKIISIFFIKLYKYTKNAVIRVARYAYKEKVWLTLLLIYFAVIEGEANNLTHQRTCQNIMVSGGFLIKYTSFSPDLKCIRLIHESEVIQAIISRAFEDDEPALKVLVIKYAGLLDETFNKAAEKVASDIKANHGIENIFEK